MPRISAEQKILKVALARRVFDYMGLEGAPSARLTNEFLYFAGAVSVHLVLTQEWSWYWSLSNIQGQLVERWEPNRWGVYRISEEVPGVLAEVRGQVEAWSGKSIADQVDAVFFRLALQAMRALGQVDLKGLNEAALLKTKI